MKNVKEEWSGSRLEGIHISARGESQLNSRMHPLSGMCQSLYPAHQLDSIMRLKRKKKKKSLYEGKNFTAKIKLGTEEEKLQKESSGVGTHYALIIV